MSENIEELRAALTLVATSDEVGNICESANHHSLQDFLIEIRNDLHEHAFEGGEKDCYDDGSYEVYCTYPGCWNTLYVEAP